MVDFLQDLSKWWKKESQKDLPPAIQELGKRLIEAQIRQQKQMKMQEERSFQREQKLFRRVDLCQRRLQTLEERVDLQIEIEVESQKTAFSGEVDRVMDAHETLFMEAFSMMLQTFQENLRKQHPPKGREIMPKA